MTVGSIRVAVSVWAGKLREGVSGVLLLVMRQAPALRACARWWNRHAPATELRPRHRSELGNVVNHCRTSVVASK